MSRMGKYIYGVINTSKEEVFALDEIVGLDGIGWTESCEEVPNADEISQTAYTIGFQDISAVVSHAQIVHYNRMPKETLARRLLRHQQVIEKIMAEHTIIPMRLGTFAQSDQEVEQILAKGYRTIKDIFERAKNTLEIDVAVTLNDFNSFLQEVSQENEIKQLKQSLLSKKEGVTVEGQVKVGALVKKYLEKRRTEYADRIQSVLNRLAHDFKPHSLMDDKMVLNTAFLIDQNRTRDFEQQVDELNRNFEDRLNFRCVGPLPPYSFYTLEVKKAQFEEVDWARKTLGLTGDFVTPKDIKKAHRRLALACHPDKHPEAPGIEKKFDDMTRAYRVLLDYYRACNLPGHAEGCYFSEEAFQKNAILVTTTD